MAEETRPVDKPVFEPEKVLDRPIGKATEGQETEDRRLETEVSSPVISPPSTSTEIPEKFKGKSLEEVVQSYTELEKKVGRLAKDYGDLRDYNQRILQQSQIRTQGPDLVPQGTPPQGQQGAGFLDNLLGDNSENYLKQRMFNWLNEYQQAQVYVAQQRTQQELGRIEQESDRMMRVVAAEEGMPYSDVAEMVNKEFRENKEMQQRVLGQPFNVSSNEIEDGVRTLYKKAQDTKSKEFGKYLKQHNIDPEVVSQITKARKEVAANAVPESGGGSHASSNSGAKRTKEEQAILASWGIPID